MRKKVMLVTFVLLCGLLLFSCEKDENEKFYPKNYSNIFEETDNVKGSVSCSFGTVKNGYAGFYTDSDKQIVIQLIFEDETYNFFAPKGEKFYVPLVFGNGKYTFRIMKNTVDNKFIELDKKEFEVSLINEFEPFLHANLISSFDENSKCSLKAAEIAAACETEKDFIKEVFSYVSKNIIYDEIQAENLKEGYIPDPDKTFESGKGICFDYASLTAAMLRSQGIPAKLITGYVGADARYHAWNSVYTKDSGWISVEIKVNPSDWTRIDATFAASGSSQKANYINRYIY